MKPRRERCETCLGSGAREHANLENLQKQQNNRPVAPAMQDRRIRGKYSGKSSGHRLL